MPTFDPTKPAANSEVSSSELRDQLNALNDSLTAIASTAAAAASTAATAESAVNDWQANFSTLTPLTTTYTDPVSAAALNEIRDALNAIFSTLQS